MNVWPREEGKARNLFAYKTYIFIEMRVETTGVASYNRRSCLLGEAVPAITAENRIPVAELQITDRPLCNQNYCYEITYVSIFFFQCVGIVIVHVFVSNRGFNRKRSSRFYNIQWVGIRKDGRSERKICDCKFLVGRRCGFA